MTIKVLNSRLYGSTSKYNGNVHVHGVVDGGTKITCPACLVPWYDSPLCVTNQFDGNISTVVADPDRVLNFMLGYAKPYLFTWDLDTLALSRQDYLSETVDTVTLDFISEEDELLCFVPVTTSSGVILVDEYAAGVPTGAIKSYSIDWTDLSYTYRISFAYDSVNSWVEFMAGVVKYANDRIVISLGTTIGDADYCDFLVYSESTDSFILVEGPRDSTNYWHVYRYDTNQPHFSDLGNGVCAMPLSSDDNEHVFFLDTTSGSGSTFDFPLAVDEYSYSMWDYFVMAPSMSDGALYAMIEYIYFEGGEETYGLRLVKILDNELTVIGEYMTPDDTEKGFLITYSKDQVVAIFGSQWGTSLIFYDMVAGEELFRKPFFSDTLVSNMMDDDNNIIVVRNNSVQDLIANALYDFSQADGLVYPSAWGWEGWDNIAASLAYISPYRITGSTTYQGTNYLPSKYGVLLRAKTDYFPAEEYAAGDLVWSETVQATMDHNISLSEYVLPNYRYMVTSTGVYTINKNTNPKTYCTFVATYNPGFTMGPLTSENGWGKKGTDIDSATLVNIPNFEYPNINIPFGRASSDEDHAEIFLFATENTEIGHGDAWWRGWQADNEGEITLSVYEAFLTRRELVASFNVDETAIAGSSISVVTYMPKSETAGLRGATAFVRIYFSGGSHVELTEYVSTENYFCRTFSYEVSTDVEVTRVDVGVYLGTIPCMDFNVEILVNKIYVTTAATAEEVRTISKISMTGDETDLADLSAIEGYPSIWDADDFTYARLIDNLLVYPEDAYWGRFPIGPMILHFGEE